MEPSLFKPADGYDVPDTAAILSLGGTRHKNILLSPSQLSQLTVGEVEGIIAEYGDAFETCIEEAMDGHDPDVIGSTTVCLSSSINPFVIDILFNSPSLTCRRSAIPLLENINAGGMTQL
jgi:hypothetical protein